MAALGNYAGNLSKVDESGAASMLNRRARRRRDRRGSHLDRTRRRLRLVAQRVAPPNSNLAKCGRVPCTERVQVDERWREVELGVCVKGVKGHSAAFAGLVTCGSAWACPVCAARIAYERAGEVRRAIAACRSEGGEVFMLTLTTPHDQGDALKGLQRAVADSWSYVLQGRRWQELQAQLGLVGFVRGSDDPTVGSHGWHPHLHVLVFCRRPLNVAERHALTRHVYQRWCKRIVEKHGYRKPSPDHGVRLTLSREDTYITKLGLVDELASGMYKRARDGRRTPLQLLLDAERGDRKALALYAEFVEAMKGHKRLTWSTEPVVRPDGAHTRRTLRARYVLAPENSDADVAAAEALPSDHEPGASFLVHVPGRIWKTVLAENPDGQSELLAFGRKFGEAGVTVYLRWLEALRRTARRARQPLPVLWQRIHDPPPLRLAA